MRIHSFLPDEGRYHFELQTLSAAFHAHPAIEILLAKKGTIQLETEHASYPDLRLAIIAPNTPHRVSFAEGQVQLIMLEMGPKVAETRLAAALGIELSGGIYGLPHDLGLAPERLIEALSAPPSELEMDARVRASVAFMNKSSSSYEELLGNLTAETFLSASRISHIFKQEMGLSIKKFWVWTRLKRAFHLVVTEQISMYEAAIKSGFYDQAHLSKAFRQMLGMPPSDTYNSRTLQN